MAVNFPDSPSNGDSFSVNDTTYVYNATAGYWDITSTVQVSASTSTNAPSNPSSGDFWFDPSSLTTYIYYNDGTSSQWVPANSVGARGPAGPGYPTPYYSAEYTSTSTGNVVFNANSTPSLASYSIGKVNVWVNGVLRSDFIASDGSNVEIALSTGDEVKIVNFGDTDVLDVTASSNDYATYTSLTSNDYATYTTLSSLIDTVQSNVTSGSGGSGVVVYATPDLLPLSGNDAGDQAYVSSTNRLYINTGSGWYSIGLVNTNPNITSVQDANSNITPFTLATDGTATVITITASDPEEVPLTYSYAVTSGSLTNGGGTTATVVQGTGANTNQFTITPTTNASYVGTFNLTFTVSDGINTSTSINEFTLQFTIPNSKYTTLLATAVDTSDNNNITDSSTNNHTITVTGDAHAGTFSPYRHGGYSAYFDGTGDYITTTSTDYDLGTSSAFTVELWYYFDESRTHTVFDFYNSSNAQTGKLAFTSTNVYLYDGSANILALTRTQTVGAWEHFCWTRDASNNHTFYINGSQVATSTAATSIDAYTIDLGRRAGSFNNTFMKGYIRDFRLVKGTAITPASGGPTERLTAVTNTKLLTCHLPYIADGSSSAHSITISGNTSTKPFSPYINSEYASGTNGGSIYFDGSGDYLSVADHTSLDLGTDDFTLEAWIRMGSTSGNQIIFERYTSGNNGSFQLYYRGTGNSLTFWTLADGVIAQDPSSSTIKVDSWHHVVATRESGTVKLYVDGSQVASASCTTNFDSTLSLTVGAQATTGTNYFNGYMSDCRIVKGTAVYTSDFTPPTSPLSSTGSTLHIKGTDASITDKSQNSNLKLVGNTTGSTTQTKFANTKSMYFDGTGDRAFTTSVPDLGDIFTIEAWIYSAASGNASIVGSIDNYGTFGGNGYWGLLRNASNKLILYLDGGTYTQSTSTIPLNQWVHVVCIKSGGTIYYYIDGTQDVTTVSNSLSLTNPSGLVIGSSPNNNYIYNWNGYIQDLRITKGLARYTANFTPPTAPFKG